ncbi:MAG: SMI1/KNR4 family protein [Candidatus Obscuribacter sp.]|nr:SMI1/KNR4 family protein [Candidatus Obscuribacter sp.]
MPDRTLAWIGILLQNVKEWLLSLRRICDMPVKSPISLREDLVQAGFAESKFGFLGCTEDEITSLERKMQISLPSAYKDFLRAFGKESGDFLSDCTHLYADLPAGVRRSALAKAERSGFELEPRWFVFLSRDDIFFYFDTSMGEDPPVWRYDESCNRFEQVFPSYSQWLNTVVSDEVQGMIRIKRMRQK